MALVRRVAVGADRAGTVGRAQVPGAIAPPSAAAGTAAPAQPGQVPVGYEMAAAVPSKPANLWAVMTGLGLAAAGAVGAWNVNQMMAPSPFEVGNDISAFAALFVFATAVERIIEPITRWMPGRVEQERYEKAIADQQRGFLLVGEDAERTAQITAALRDALAVAGPRGYWRTRLEIRQQNPRLRTEWECDVAAVQTRLGDKDGAFASLERAYQEQLFDVLFLTVAPEFDALRGDPRFEELVRRIGLPQ